MKKESTSVIMLAALVACIASTASALEEGLLLTWLNFVDFVGIGFLWKMLYKYTFLFPITLFFCGLNLDKKMNTFINTNLLEIVGDAFYDDSLDSFAICEQGFNFMLDEIWYTDIKVLGVDFEEYNYTP